MQQLNQAWKKLVAGVDLKNCLVTNHQNIFDELTSIPFPFFSELGNDVKIVQGSSSSN